MRAFAIAIATALAAIATSSCTTVPTTAEVVANEAALFMEAIQRHCGRAYEGKLVSNDASDADFARQRMVMHVRSCEPGEIRIPFHVGDNRSRTWILTRLDDGLRLKHDHRHEDGKPDAVTMYGGDTDDLGTAIRQRFIVDEESIAMFKREGLDQSVTNVWAMEIGPSYFTYELQRPTGRFFRVEFDLTKPVTPPPPPWGS